MPCGRGTNTRHLVTTSVGRAKGDPRTPSPHRDAALDRPDGTLACRALLHLRCQCKTPRSIARMRPCRFTVTVRAGSLTFVTRQRAFVSCADGVDEQAVSSALRAGRELGKPSAPSPRALRGPGEGRATSGKGRVRAFASRLDCRPSPSTTEPAEEHGRDFCSIPLCAAQPRVNARSHARPRSSRRYAISLRARLHARRPPILTRPSGGSAGPGHRYCDDLNALAQTGSSTRGAAAAWDNLLLRTDLRAEKSQTDGLKNGGCESPRWRSTIRRQHEAQEIRRLVFRLLERRMPSDGARA